MRVVADWLCQRGFPVEYMGLWDTVDSTVGIKGEDYIELPSNVKFARHAVARDEFRRFFNYLPLREGNREEGTGWKKLFFRDAIVTWEDSTTTTTPLPTPRSTGSSNPRSNED